LHITRLHVENFQNHRNTRLSLSPGLNVIFGEAEQGKSALIRALAWLFFNLPPGADFRRSGSLWCRVSALLDNGALVARERRGDDLAYILRLPGQSPVTIPDDGDTIPAAVSAAHGMLCLAVDHGPPLVLHLADQFAPPFLLEEDPSRRAAFFDRLRGAHLAAAAAQMADESPEDVSRQAGLLLQRLAERIRRDTYCAVERVVNFALQAVFGPGYSFRIHTEGAEKDAPVLLAVATPYGVLCDGGRLGRAHGGGLVDFVGLALRLAALAAARPPIPGPLILDEPVRFLSHRYVPDLARLLRLAAQDLQRQIIVATHDQHLTSAADTVFVLADEGGSVTPHTRGMYRRRPPASPDLPKTR